MTATHTLDGITNEAAPAAPEFDSDGDPIDDFAGGSPSWPTLDQEPTPAADVVPAADSAPDGAAAAPAEGEGPETAEPIEPQAGADFPADLLADAGLTAEQARSQFRTPDALEAALNFHLQRVVSAGRQQRAQFQQPKPTQLPAGLQGITPPQPPAAEAVQPPSGQQPAAPGKGWYKPFSEVVKNMKDADGDPIYADETIKLLEAQDAHWAKIMDEMAGQIEPALTRSERLAQQLAAERAQQAMEKTYQSMEQRFNDLGDEWADTFGKGDAREIVKANPNDPVIQARVKVAETMEAIKTGRAVNGLPPLDDDTVFQQALRVDFSPKLQELQQRGVKVRRASRDNLRTIRPTQRKTPAGTQNARTLAAVEKVLQQRGRSLGPPGEEVIEGF